MLCRAWPKQFTSCIELHSSFSLADNILLLRDDEVEWEARLTHDWFDSYRDGMYWFISFLRAPPIHAVPNPFSPLCIKIQITNDLRTEFYSGDTDLFYAWIQFNETVLLPLTSTPFTKLTTWRQSNTYAELNVYPPKGVRDGQQWQLALCTPGERRGQTVLSAINLPLDHETVDITPFPVLSRPILFKSTKLSNVATDGKGSKQEKIERLFKLPSWQESPSTQPPDTNNLKTKGNVVKITEHLGFDLDKVSQWCPPPISEVFKT